MKRMRSGFAFGVLAVLLVPVWALIAPTAANAATTTITSAGPLTSIGNSTDLNCSVNHTGDDDGEWFGDTACATLLATGGTLYGPAEIPAGGAAAPRTTWTEVSQTPVTGAGTTASPFKVVTVVTAAATGLRVTQTDTYVVGEESYRNDVSVTNTGTGAQTAVLYRGGDCFLQNSDSGFGIFDAGTGAVSCTTDLTPGSRIEQMLPLTAGSSHFEGFFNDLWANIGTQNPLPNTCDCATDEDNSIGLSWNLNLAAGASRAFSSIVTFSPVGNVPVTLAKTADASSAAAGANDGYTITATNDNPGDVTLATLTDTLPAGFSYRAGTTTGATTANPTINGQNLTWGPITVPGGGTASIHFGVTVSNTPGVYNDDAEGTAGSFTVVGTGPTAPVTVTGGPPANRPPTATSQSVTTPENTPVGVTLAGSDPDGDAITFAVGTGPAHGTLSGTGANLTYTPTAGYTGPDSFTFTTNDGQLSSAPATVTITVTPPAGCVAPVLDKVRSADQTTAASSFTSAKFSTTAPNELLLAFIEADGPFAPTQSIASVTGGAGLTWTLAARSNTTWGTTEVWQAYATGKTGNIHVTANLAKPGFDGSITIAAFKGAATHVGAVGVGAGVSGPATVGLTTTACSSLVWGAAHDWTNAASPVPGAGQSFVHGFRDRRVLDSFWTQQLNAAVPAGTAVTLSDTGFTMDRWTFAAVEIPSA